MNPISLNKTDVTTNNIGSENVSNKEVEVSKESKLAKDILKQDENQAPVETSKKRKFSVETEETKLELKTDLASKSTEIWEAVDRLPSPNGKGYIYKFKVRPEFDTYSDVQKENDPGNILSIEAAKKNFKEANKRVFPAIEPSPESLLDWIEEVNTDLSEDDGDFAQKSLRLIGYKAEKTDEGFFLYLPDREANISGWEKVLEVAPELDKLKIFESSGIENDKRFLMRSFKYHAIVSKNKEFVHDIYSHLHSVLLLLLDYYNETDTTFDEDKNRVVGYLKTLTDKIKSTENELRSAGKLTEENTKNLEIAYFLTAAFADVYFATQEADEFHSIDPTTIKGFMSSLWDSSKWQSYIQNRFGDAKLDKKFVDEILKSLDG